MVLKPPALQHPDIHHPAVNRPSSNHPSRSNSKNAFGMLDWFGIVTIRIQQPGMRIWLTALKLCDPPQTCINASVLTYVGRIPSIASGNQSICSFIMPDIVP